MPVPDLIHSNAHLDGMDVGERSQKANLICSIEHVDGQGAGEGVSVLDLTHSSSVADPDPGSGAILTPGSGIRDPE